MATPTPGATAGKHPTTTVGATPPVSTPFSGSHLAAFSPPHGPGAGGPRSVVPSPQQFKKSPANSNTVYGHPTSSSFGGGGAVNFDSPSAIGVLPPLVGVGELGNDPLALVGGAGRGTGADETERARRLDVVLDILRTNKGRVSEEGIERLARRIGLECLWETQMGSGSSVRTLVIAGTGLALDVEFRNNVVTEVAVSFSESSDLVTKHAASAGKILLRDLQLGPGESPLTKSLDRFAANLERLAAVDKLSIMPVLNCHEAIAGVYESLKKLHEWEVSRLKEEASMAAKSKKEIERIALCTKSGWPMMNVRGIVGMSLDYWQERHRGPKKEQVSSTDSDEGDTEVKTWSLIAECSHSSAMVYPPIRVTDKWLSSTIEKANPTADDLLLTTSGPVLDWQDPENILLPASSDAQKVEGMIEGIEQDPSRQNGTKRLPDVMFVAKFNPPLAVPYGVAMQIYSSTGATLDAAYQVSAFDALLLPHDGSGDGKGEPDGAHRRLQRVQKVTRYDRDGKQSQHHLENRLTVHKIEYGRTLTEVPFSHPRQLVDMLPILRQWARLSTLLDRSFGNSVHKGYQGEKNDGEKKDDDALEAVNNVRDDFASFMSNGYKNEEEEMEETVQIDVSLYTSPAPRIRLTFPFRDGTGDIWLEVGREGVINVMAQNIVADGEPGPEAGGSGNKITKDDLGRILEVAEDLGIFVEFLRAKLGR